jgi:carotenoid cleavage dioxygenase-like enzyme
MTSIKTAIRSVVHKGIETLAEFNRKRLPALDWPHPYLTGIYEPITRELVIADLTVAGTIPAELDGRYLRIGPNPIASDPKSYHLVHRRRHGAWR